jgi:RNA-directed DNA polymerase
LKSIRLSRPKKTHLIRYADDFIVTAVSKEVLEKEVKLVVEIFLQERGLNLSEEKTSMTHIDKGFDFLGFNIIKYKRKLLIKTSKYSIKKFLNTIRMLIKSHKTVKAYRLVAELNPKIIGWGNYYRHVISSEVFTYIDDCIYRCIARWTKRRHNNKNKYWIAKKYFCRQGLSNWFFFGVHTNKKGFKAEKHLKKMGSISIKRHINIKKRQDCMILNFLTTLSTEGKEDTKSYIIAIKFLILVYLEQTSIIQKKLLCDDIWLHRGLSRVW